MTVIELKIVESIGLIGLTMVLRYLFHLSYRKVKDNYGLQKHRLIMISKVVNVLLLTISSVLLFMIWGVDRHDLFLFVSSFLAFLGIAFFAQWSILSNITAGIIFFLSHPAKIGDKIYVIDKECPIEGTIRHIGVLFITLRTEEGELVTMPNNMVMQKLIKILNTQKTEIDD